LPSRKTQPSTPITMSDLISVRSQSYLRCLLALNDVRLLVSPQTAVPPVPLAHPQQPQPFQAASKAAALDLVRKSPETAAQLQQTYQQLFGTYTSVSAVTQAYSGEDKLVYNDDCNNTVSVTLDAADSVLEAMASMEQYVHLTVPKMEDGGNFGVGVQLAAAKVIQDARDKMEKSVEELYKYASTRADALEKLKLPSKSSTKSTTNTTSESKGQDKEKGETQSSSNSQSIETKATESSSECPETKLRQAAVVAVDARFYTKAKATFQLTITSFLTVADFLDKNKVKIEKPKGDGGSRGYSGSMY